jgi:hypothetical protein
MTSVVNYVSCVPTPFTHRFKSGQSKKKATKTAIPTVDDALASFIDSEEVEVFVKAISSGIIYVKLFITNKNDCRAHTPIRKHNDGRQNNQR